MNSELLAQHPESLYWLAAARLPSIGPILFHRCLELFSDIQTFFSASVTALEAANFSPNQIDSIKNPDWHQAEKDLMWCEKNNCHLITFVDSHYPPLLREIPSAPLVLYVRGELALLKQSQIAIVGTRNPTPTGRELAHHFAYTLAKAELSITSGLALGIDAASHRGALSAGGKTVAVFGTGLNTIYPASHCALAQEILEKKGALISEFSPYEPPRAAHFPQRNRIISGLSVGVLVIEAAMRSGSLITARYANEQGRDVFAVPGSIHNPLARGCHHLIRQGAKLAETAEDIVEELTHLRAITVPIKTITQTKNHAKLAPPLRALLVHIGYEVTALDTIMMRSGLTAGEVSSMLLSLELQGFIRTMHGGYQLT
ncbi:MAG: hypothetical protein K0S27_357 [Gammaproteobacteria bacterium]|nr:hypothetical protein [Gammaproteobacteria bacterium]